MTTEICSLTETPGRPDSSLLRRRFLSQALTKRSDKTQHLIRGLSAPVFGVRSEDTSLLRGRVRDVLDEKKAKLFFSDACACRFRKGRLSLEPEPRRLRWNRLVTANSNDGTDQDKTGEDRDVGCEQKCLH
jgi:hypothetical protein